MKIPNLIEISQAWRIRKNPTDEQQKIAEERMAVCEVCEYKHFNTLIKTYNCNACGCFLGTKIYSPLENPCPEKKWRV